MRRDGRPAALLAFLAWVQCGMPAIDTDHMRTPASHLGQRQRLLAGFIQAERPVTTTRAEWNSGSLSPATVVIQDPCRSRPDLQATFPVTQVL